MYIVQILMEYLIPWYICCMNLAIGYMNLCIIGKVLHGGTFLLTHSLVIFHLLFLTFISNVRYLKHLSVNWSKTKNSDPNKKYRNDFKYIWTHPYAVQIRSCFNVVHTSAVWNASINCTHTIYILHQILYILIDKNKPCT